MNHELFSAQERSLPSTRTECYLACNYAVLNPFALSLAQEGGPLSVLQLEQEIARGAATDYPDLFDHVEDPLERGRMILRDPSINPVVEEAEAFVELEMLFDEVDRHFDMLEEQEWRQLAGERGSVDRGQEG